MKLIFIPFLMMTSLLTWAGPRVVGNGFLAETTPTAPTADKINYPFLGDSRIANTNWCSIDLVNKIETFKPNHKEWKDDLYLRKIIFLPIGDVCWDYEYKENLCGAGDKLEYLKSNQACLRAGWN